jgi:hypothetical protein
MSILAKEVLEISNKIQKEYFEELKDIFDAEILAYAEDGEVGFRYDIEENEKHFYYYYKKPGFQYPELKLTKNFSEFINYYKVLGYNIEFQTDSLKYIFINWGDIC